MKKVFFVLIASFILTFNPGIVQADDKPGYSVTFPFFCEIAPNLMVSKAAKLLRTSFSVADTADLDPSNTTHYGWFGLYAPNGTFQMDWNAAWTQYDVISHTCTGLISQMSQTGKDALKITIAGKNYYAGYVTYNAGPIDGVTSESLIGWGNFYYSGLFGDTDAGFNGVPDFDAYSWAADKSLYLRYDIENDKSGTFNWWIILTPSPQGNWCTRVLQCFICDEDENCFSHNIAIGKALNVANVLDQLPPPLKINGYPYKGFAQCSVAVQAVYPGINEELCTDLENDKIAGWLYQYTRGNALAGDKATVIPVHVKNTSYFIAQ